MIVDDWCIFWLIDWLYHTTLKSCRLADYASYVIYLINQWTVVNQRTIVKEVNLLLKAVEEVTLQSPRPPRHRFVLFFDPYTLVCNVEWPVFLTPLGPGVRMQYQNSVSFVVNLYRRSRTVTAQTSRIRCPQRPREVLSAYCPATLETCDPQKTTCRYLELFLKPSPYRFYNRMLET